MIPSTPRSTVKDMQVKTLHHIKYITVVNKNPVCHKVFPCPCSDSYHVPVRKQLIQWLSRLLYLHRHSDSLLLW